MCAPCEFSLAYNTHELTVNSKFNGLRADQAKQFEADMGREVHVISGKLQGLEISRQEILGAAEHLGEQNMQLSLQQDEVARRLVQHERVLREILKMCTAGLIEVGQKSGIHVGLAKTIDEAKQIIAVFGGVTGDTPGSIEIAQMIAQGKSRQIGITNDPNLALQFLQ
jgi:hypothetical protein